MKKILAVLGFGAIVATGAFAQLSFGVTELQYYEEGVTAQQAFEDLKTMNGVYFGGFAELTIKKLGFGASFSISPTVEGYDGNYQVTALDQMAYDVNLYLAYHLFGGKAFIDPIVQAGIGMYAYNYQDPIAAEYYYEDNYYTYGLVDQDDPLAASMYYDIGVGLGINLGHIGVFTKVMYNQLIDGVIMGTDDYSGDAYEIPAMDPMPVKVTFGAKIIL